jgi:hypothetical protein
MLIPTSDSLSIFEDGKLKPGIYKIQNLFGQTFMDIHEHSREVCCRPATALGEGRGLVRPFQLTLLSMYVSDDEKWEIKPLGAGYSVQRVSKTKYLFRRVLQLFDNTGLRSSAENQNSFAFHCVDWGRCSSKSQRCSLSRGLEARDRPRRTTSWV